MLRYARIVLKKRSHYEVLGVSKTASPEDIRKAFNAKAQQYHPDRNDRPGAKEKFQELFEAYKILRDDKEKKAYDKAGTEPPPQQPSWSSQRGSSFYEEPFRSSDFQDQQREYERRRQQQYNYYYQEPNRRVITINPLTPILIFFLLIQLSRFLERKAMVEEIDSEHPPTVIKSRWRQPYVLAFMNPFSGQWERLPDGYDPPPIRELMHAEVPRKGWESLEGKLPKTMTVGYVPQSLSREAKVLWSRDLKKVVSKT